MRVLLSSILLCAVSAAAGSNSWNVLTAGAVPDGKADCTAVFQQLLDGAGQAGGGVVEVPAGRYRINSGLVVPANVTLQGVFRVPPTCSRVPLDSHGGSVLLAYAGRGAADGPPFIRLAGSNGSIAGFTIAYPEWQQTDVPPVPYPPCILSEGTENVGVRDCCLLNPYEGIKLVRAHRHLIRNVTGYPISRGIHVDECYDIGHIENIHFWPFGVAYNPDDPYCKWINTQGVAIELARTDWHYVHNTFCFGYGIGYRFSNSAHGSTNGNFLGLGADSCQRAVLVEQAQAPGLLITNGEFVGRWHSTDSVCLEVGPEVAGKVSLVNCSFWGPIDRCVWMRSPNGQFTASACNFVDWDHAGSGSPAIQLDAGRAIIQACTFARDQLQVAAEADVASVLVTANQAPGGLRIRNEAGKRLQAALNEDDHIAWTPEVLSHYQVTVGAPGDGRYLDGWHHAETHDHPLRWSRAKSRLLLPVLPGRQYTLELQIAVPPQAMDPEAGLYLDGRKIAPLPAVSPWTVALPTTTTDRLTAEIRVKEWIPGESIAGSTDRRSLGIQLRSIVLRDTAAPASTPFNANTGR